MYLIYTSSTLNVASPRPRSRMLKDSVKAARKMLKGWQQLNQQTLLGRRFIHAEPTIREVISADGQIAWEVYEPISRLTKTCRNRSEVQAWLGQ